MVGADRDSGGGELEGGGNRSRLQLQPRRNLYRNYRLDFAAHAPDQRLQPVERRKRRNRILHVIVGEIQFDNLDARAVERLRNFYDLLVRIADDAPDDRLAVRAKLARDRREMLDAAVLELVRRFEAGDIACF